MRLDELLVKRGHATSRSQAKQLVQNGSVHINGQPATKPAQNASDEDKITLTEEQKYVGRGAKKIEAALNHFQIDPSDLTVADIGASTGGFTDYLLQHGAKKVYAIDVGTGQLADRLLADPRIINMEGINIKNPLKLPELCDLAVVDLSYISLQLVLKNIAALIKPQAKIITLIKPQFEAGPKIVGKDGVIKDKETRQKILKDFRNWCAENHFNISTIIPSPITGKQGNQEYLAEITSQ